LVDLGIDGKNKIETGYEMMGYIQLVKDKARSCGKDNEPPCSIKGEEFLEQLGNYQLLMDSAP
jgi:hypothetical protein